MGTNRSGPQLGGFLLPSDLALAHGGIHRVGQGFVGSERKTLGNRVDAPIAERRQLYGRAQLVSGLEV